MLEKSKPVITIARFSGEIVELMRDLKTSQVALIVKISTSQMARLAATIPGHKLSKGGHHRFQDCPEFWAWVEARQKPHLKNWKKLTANSGFIRPLLQIQKYYSEERLKMLPSDTAQKLISEFEITILKLQALKRWLAEHFELDDEI
jgi:hypothetical protein